MVDAVITWVDGDDQKLKQKKMQYNADYIDPRMHPEAKSSTRYADNNEVWYCIYSIRKFAPWIDKIFIVTDDQKPLWLDGEKIEKLNLEIVDHKVIFAGFEDYLPTFNSLTIETMLHNIPGLSKNFLYLNDDMCFIRPVTINDYFNQGKLKFRGEWLWKIKLKQRLAKLLNLTDMKKNTWIGQGYIGDRNEERYLKKSKYMLFRLAHAPYPMNINSCKKLLLKYGNIEEQIKYRFKSREQFNIITLLANDAMLNGYGQQGCFDFGYITCSKMVTSQVDTLLDYYKKSDRVKSLCIQSLDQADDITKGKILRFLNDQIAH